MQLPHATEADGLWAAGQWPGTTQGSLEMGRSLYAQRCSGCHRLYLPSAFSPQQWPVQVTEMSVRAKLAAQDIPLLTRYLVVLSVRSRQSADATKH